MQSRCLEHVSVWFDCNRADQNILSQAVECAFRLSLPVRAFVSEWPRKSESDARATSEPGAIVERMRALSLACGQRGIVLEMFLSTRCDRRMLDRFFRPHGLCIFAERVSPSVPCELMERSARDGDVAAMICTPTSSPLKRVLIVHGTAVGTSVYFENAIRMCSALDVEPIVLIVADTEREADLRQGYAEAVCHAFRQRAEFDFVVDADIRSAVRHVAAWRRCSHLIVDRRMPASWWRVASGHPLIDSLSILALPDTVALDAPQRMTSNPSANLRRRPANFSHPDSTVQEAEFSR